MSDETLNLDDVNLDEDLGDMDLSGYGEIDLDISEPHFKLSSKDFKEVLKIAKAISGTTGKDPASKALCMIPDDIGVLHCYSTDFDVFLCKDIVILNAENILKEPVIVSVDTLIKLAKAVPSSTVIYRKEENYYIRLYGGDMILETVNFPVDRFIFSDPITESGVIESKDLYLTMKDFSSVVTSAVSPDERRIMMSEDRAQVVYLWSVILSKKAYQPMDLKVKDINILKALLVNIDEPLKISYTNEEVQTKRAVIQGNGFSYSFLISDKKLDVDQEKLVTDIIGKSGVYVDFLQLYKTIELASELDYAVGKVGMSYDSDSIVIGIKNKKGDDSMFTLKGNTEGKLNKFKGELEVQAKLLKVILKTFATSTSVRVTLSDKGISVKNDDYEAVIVNNK